VIFLSLIKLQRGGDLGDDVESLRLFFAQACLRFFLLFVAVREDDALVLRLRLVGGVVLLEEMIQQAAVGDDRGIKFGDNGFTVVLQCLAP